MPLPDGIAGVALVGVLLLLATFPLVFLFRLIMAPFWLIAEKDARIAILEAEIRGVSESPLKVVFDQKNPNKEFWDQRSIPVDEHVDGSTIYDWGTQYRIGLTNISNNTVSNVSAFIDRGRGDYSVLCFSRTGQESVDIHPNATEYVDVYFHNADRDELSREFLKMLPSSTEGRPPNKIKVRALNMKEVQVLFSFDSKRNPRFLLH